MCKNNTLKTNVKLKKYSCFFSLQASDKDWMQLQGKFLINGTVSKAAIYIEGPPPSTDLLVNSLVVKHAERPSPAPVPDFSVSAFKHLNLQLIYKIQISTLGRITNVCALLQY
jgi:hypothetical protein